MTILDNKDSIVNESEHAPIKPLKLKDCDFMNWKVFKRIENHTGLHSMQSDDSDCYNAQSLNEIVEEEKDNRHKYK